MTTKNNSEHEESSNTVLTALSESGHLQIEADALRNLLFRFYCRGDLDERQKETFNQFYLDNLEGAEYESYQDIYDRTNQAYYAIGRIEEKPDLKPAARQVLIKQVLEEMASAIIRTTPVDRSGT